MTTRIAYIISAGPTEGRTVPREVVSDGFDVDVVPSYGAPFPSNAVELLVTELATVDAAMRAQAHGYAGVLIGAVADYGIDAVRAAVRVPAIGCGQASLLAASGLGRRFSVVTIWPPSTAPLYRGLLQENDVVSRCASVRHITRDQELSTLSDDTNFYTEMRAGREHMISRILEEIEAAVTDDGADVVVLGCNCMTPVAPILAERASVPVVDPTTTGYKFLEMLLSLGLTTSTKAYAPATVDRAPLFGELIDVVRQSQSPDAVTDCEVCALTEDGSACELPGVIEPDPAVTR